MSTVVKSLTPAQLFWCLQQPLGDVPQEMIEPLQHYLATTRAAMFLCESLLPFGFGTCLDPAEFRIAVGRLLVRALVKHGYER